MLIAFRTFSNEKHLKITSYWAISCTTYFVPVPNQHGKLFMPLALINSRANLGLESPLITIEVHLSRGLPGICIVGLPAKAVKESKDRVRSAILNSRFQFPVSKIVINLAPADLPKEGARFDLPIALGILAADEQISVEALKNAEFAGELTLTGLLNPVKGVLPMALATRELNHALILPKANAAEASLAEGLTIFAADNLYEVCAHLNSQQFIKKFPTQLRTITSLQSYPDLADVRGQVQARRALEIAAAGAHSILFSGSPGTGKTMLSSRLPSILPMMTDKESQSTAVIYSVSNRGFDASDWGVRPFRAPHHTASSVALVGGGSPQQQTIDRKS